jgi:hypothetical protein
MIRIAIILVIIATFFGVSKIYKYFKNKSNDEAPVKVLVKDIVQKDSNNNGIPDWEEFLWGLNPEKDGQGNKEIIMQKKQALAEKDNSLFSGEGKTKENEMLSKEFFSIIMSLLQSGNLDQNSMTEISKIIGEKIESAPIPDVYTQNMLKIKKGGGSSLAYIDDFQKLTDKYENSDMGSELSIVAQGLSKNDPQALYAVKTIASSYRSFGQELIKIQVPESIFQGHLSLANDYEKMAQSIEGLSQILDDPMTGMRALINYKKYSDSVLSDLDNISSNLE